MKSTKHNRFRRILSGFLSAACVFSGTAVLGATMVNESTIPVSAATTATQGEAPFTWDNASVYFLLTDRFCNGDTSNDHSYGRGLNQNGQAVSYDTLGAFQGGDFAGITKKINEGYFDDLGVNAIWLSAPYEQLHGYCVGGDGDSFAHYSYHGYYVLDYTESDKNFGTKAEFKTLVDTAHEHGIRIVMDVVMNHAGYQTLQDMSEYGFGPLKSGWESYYYAHQNVNNKDYHGFIGYDDNTAGDWAKWWGSNWIRSGLPGYTKGSGEIEGCLADLPDFKTGDTSSVGLPQILITKWGKEGTLSAKQAKYGNDNVSGYISTWLAEWVSEFGVDGFRCDTAKHVEMSAWKKLKDKCVAALKQWRQNNPSAPGANWTDDFWMTGECFGHKVVKDNYFTSGAFDSMINFDFAEKAGSSYTPSPGDVEGKYSSYANKINNDPQFNVLTYLASHDTALINGDRYNAGSFLLMCPGGIQIYYGDETNRPYDTNPKAMKDLGAGHQTRKFMNWDSIDQALLTHWQKLGQFRRNHLAVGAGQHQVISAYSSSSGYTFARTYSKGDIDDKIVATLFAPANTSLTIDVSSVWSDGIEITNFYDGTTCKVSGGKVTFNTGANGTILMQEPQGKKGKVVVTHIDQDKGTTIKTETMAGLIGDSYTVQPLTMEGFTVSNTTGSMTGTYSENEASVKIYYTFDTENYGYVKTTYVNASSGEELADPETITGKVGNTYSVTPKDIKNYEVDESLTNNATGKFAKGTTTVTFKYNYVEPTNLRVHYYNANNWSKVNMYAYLGDGETTTKLLGVWPGTAMTDEGNGWFFCEVPDNESAKVLFNDGGTNQEPAKEKPGYELSGEVWLKNGTAVGTGKVSVKYVTTDGQTLATQTLTGVADGETTYTTTARTFDGYTLKSTPENATGLFKSATQTVIYTYEANATELSNNSKVSSTSVNVGDTVTLTGAASGGTSPYKYAFYFKKSGDSSWSVKGTEYGTATTATLNPGTATTYTVKISVKDNAGTVKDKTFSINVSGYTTALTNNSKVSTTSTTVGSNVTLTGAASGGTSPYKYAFYFRKSGASSWSVKGTEYGTATTATLNPGTATTYEVKISVKDSAGTVKDKTFSIKVSENTTTFTNNSKVSATTVTVGDTVTITGAASGGKAPYKYAYYYKKSGDSSWSIKGTEYGTATSATLNPGTATTYYVKVEVMDSTGSIKAKDFTIKVNAALANNSKVSKTTANVGDSITLTGAASGGTSPYKYAFYFRKGTATDWTVKGTEYGTATTATLNPSTATTYYVMIKVKDASGKVVSKNFSINVKTPLTNNSKVSATTVSTGDSVTLTGAASGGTSPYKYAFYFRKGTATDWTVKGTEYGTATTATLNPGTATTYEVKINVKDNAGTVQSKTFKITVKGPLTNNSKVSATSVETGKNVTLTGAASGGTAPYKYAYYFKKSGDNSWSIKGTEYGTATTATLTPGTATTYNVMIKVKDATGTTSSKTFNITVTAALTNNSKMNATSVKPGSTVTITGAATGGKSPYKYAFYYRKGSETNWTLKGTEYGTATTATLNPGTETKYEVMVKVKDSAGTVKSKTMTLNVSNSANLTNNSKVSANTVKVNNNVTLTAAATGGTAPYKYAFYYKKSSATSWSVKGTEYGTATTATLTPGSAVYYDVKISVKDSSGKVVSKEFSINVTK